MQNMKKKQSTGYEHLEPKLMAVTNQLLDLGKRNRLLNYRDTGLKTLKLLNKNSEEIFRGVKAYRDLKFYDVDKAVLEYHNSIEDEEAKANDDILQYEQDFVYSLVRKFITKELFAYKRSYQLQRALKSLMKDSKTSLIEKGINPLYISFGFIHYIENENEFVAPLLLIPVELNFEEDCYQLRQYEDDILLNPTLKFYLETAYNVILPEYKDEAYSTYLENLQKNLTDKVFFEDGVSLGIYSFYKMNMYNDLISNKDKVLQNKNIRALLGEPDSIEILSEKQPVYPVVNFDSSQLDAIQNAANGKSFCLQGPPGSGKSQTITNMISTFLGQGKKILFVSEKIAALNVVYENLRRAKLSEFALELHSNKANKKEFIEKLYTAATLPRYEMELKTRILESKYANLRNLLNSYESKFHDIIPGLDSTLLDLYSMYLSNPVEPISINVELEGVNRYDLEQIELLLNEYTIYSKSLCDDYRKSGLYGLNLSTFNDLQALSYDLDVILKHLFTLSNYEIKLLKCGLLTHDKNTLSSIYSALTNVDKIKAIKTFNPYYFNKNMRARIADSLEKYLSISKYLKEDIFNIYKKEIMNEDIDKLIKDIRDNNKGLFKNSTYKNAVAKAMSYRLMQNKPEDICKELEDVNTYKKYYNSAKIYIADLDKFVPDWKKATPLSILTDIKALNGIPDMTMNEARYKLIKSETNDILPFDRFKGVISRIVALSELFYLKDIDISKSDIDTVAERFTEINNERDNIYNYQELIKVVSKIEDKNCLDFLHTYLDMGLPIEDLSRAYEKTFVRRFIEKIHADSELLKEFKSVRLDDIINEFRDLDERNLSINRDFIIARNSSKRQDDLVEGSQFKILDKEYNKSRRQLPIRTLLEKTFELALDIKPVFLMSPLSVSTYLASELNMFDVVIFDEASQIFACDAFGSIYRGKQCIVIGDTKQMPPTAFFQASAETIGSQVEEEQFEEEEFDLESILDKASNTFETKALKWHYRSRTEELIVFSNINFYDHTLISIPQSLKHRVGFGIDYVYLKDGLYNAQTRTNPDEAQAICDMVFDHLDKKPNESVGVVAFSNVQAELIQSLIDKRLKKQPKYEKFFNPDLEEPVFVKNLESVQGDERDRIIFSICYGFNKDGKFYQRFGPLNASGGERRLNVAITRAKINVTVVASIKYSDIRDNPDSLGVTSLKNYLKFAENAAIDVDYDSSDDGTIRSISDYIESLGYDVVPGYGFSSFKVDLAVRDRKTKNYILAIMLDGNSNYSSSLTDNYRLERMLLERQGWKYYKMFITSWIDQREVEMERIKQAIEGTLIEGEEYEHHDHTGQTYLRIEGNEDVIDLSYTTYQYLDRNKARKLFIDEGMERLVKEIITVESPIHKEYLVKRAAQLLNEEKVTNEFKAKVLNAIPDRVLKLGEFLINFQVSDIKLRLESDRDLQYIYVDEYADGIYNTTLKNNGISEAGCFKTVVNLLGQDRVNANSKKLLTDALEHLILDRKIEEKNGNLFIIRH